MTMLKHCRWSIKMMRRRRVHPYPAVLPAREHQVALAVQAADLTFGIQLREEDMIEERFTAYSQPYEDAGYVSRSDIIVDDFLSLKNGFKFACEATEASLYKRPTMTSERRAKLLDLPNTGDKIYKSAWIPRSEIRFGLGGHCGSDPNPLGMHVGRDDICGDCQESECAVRFKWISGMITPECGKVRPPPGIAHHFLF
jgi:hypothetical protein